MKEEKVITLWKNEAFQEKATKGLEKARLACQRLLDEWNKLDLGTITDMDDLQLNPEVCYKRALMATIPVPEESGRFAVNKNAVYEGYIATHDVPDPSVLIRTAKEIMKILYCSVPNLFITDGKTVTLDEELVKFYTSMSDVIISRNEPDKVAKAAKLEEWIKLTNELNVECNQELFDSSSPISNRFFMGKCTFVNTDNQGRLGTLEFDPEFLRRVLQ